MACEITWLEPGKVVQIEFHDIHTLDEIRYDSQQLLEFLNAGTGRRVHIVAAMTGFRQFPVPVGKIDSATAEGLQHPKVGWMICITDNRTIRYVTASIAGLSGVRYRAFQSHEAGLAFLNKVDRTLPPLLAQQQDGD